MNQSTTVITLVTLTAASYIRKSLSVAAAMPSALHHFTVRPILTEIFPFGQNNLSPWLFFLL